MAQNLEHRCPHCKQLNTKVRAVNDADVLPEDGDITMCFVCGDWAIFERGRARRPTKDELADIQKHVLCQEMVKGWLAMQLQRAHKQN
jgi:hypothetical protein